MTMNIICVIIILTSGSGIFFNQNRAFSKCRKQYTASLMSTEQSPFILEDIMTDEQREKHRMYMRKWNNTSRAIEYRKKWREENKEKERKTKHLWKINNRERVFFTNKKNKYGISKEYCIFLFKKANNKCEICGEGKIITLDHNHDTGDIRGILCSPCNLKIGMIQKPFSENQLKYLRYYGMCNKEYRNYSRWHLS